MCWRDIHSVAVLLRVVGEWAAQHAACMPPTHACCASIVAADGDGSSHSTMAAGQGGQPDSHAATPVALVSEGRVAEWQRQLDTAIMLGGPHFRAELEQLISAVHGSPVEIKRKRPWHADHASANTEQANGAQRPKLGNDRQSPLRDSWCHFQRWGWDGVHSAAQDLLTWLWKDEHRCCKLPVSGALLQPRHGLRQALVITG